MAGGKEEGWNDGGVACVGVWYPMKPFWVGRLCACRVLNVDCLSGCCSWKDCNSSSFQCTVFPFLSENVGFIFLWVFCFLFVCPDLLCWNFGSGEVSKISLGSSLDRSIIFWLNLFSFLNRIFLSGEAADPVMPLPFEFFCGCLFFVEKELSISLVFCSCFLKDFSRLLSLRLEWAPWKRALERLSSALVMAVAVAAVASSISDAFLFAFRFCAAVASLLLWRVCFFRCVLSIYLWCWYLRFGGSWLVPLIESVRVPHYQG